MKKNIIFGLFMVFLLLVSTNTVSAYFFSPPFGGKVVSPKANEIVALELQGFKCVVLGSTFSISPFGPLNTPISYFVPVSVLSVTGNVIGANQFIMGQYSSIKTEIECTSATVPPVITMVPLDTVTLYGNTASFGGGGGKFSGGGASGAY